MAGAKGVLFEVEDNFQKQTYRTRCYIYGANGRLLLNIPVKQANSKQKTREVLVDNSEAWQKNHLRAISSAYSSSPFFEFYQDDLKDLFNDKIKYLLDFNFKCHDFISEHLELELDYTKTQKFIQDVEQQDDFRYLADAKSKQIFNLEAYTQVFSDKHGFLKNLSILDLLFMEGPNAYNYLKRQKINRL